MKDTRRPPVPRRREACEQHVRDGFEHAEYDEISEIDVAGRITSVTQFDAQGRLRAAVRLDSAPGVGPKVTREAAIKSAQRSAAAAGLAVAMPSATEVDQANGRLDDPLGAPPGRRPGARRRDAGPPLARRPYPEPGSSGTRSGFIAPIGASASDQARR